MNAPEPARHACPWPDCNRRVEPWFWGCAAHWMMLPDELRREFARTRIRDAEVQPVAHQMAIEAIRNWMTDNAQGDKMRESQATPDVSARFSAGYATDGTVLLFWPLEGEYLVLNAAEVWVLRRLFSRSSP